MMYYAAFDVSTLALGSLTLSRAGKPDAVIPLANVASVDGEGATASIFFHYPGGSAEFAALGQDPDTTPRLSEYATFPYSQALEASIRVAINAQGWVDPSLFNVFFNPTTGQYSFGYSLAFGYTLQAAGGEFLGFTTLTSAAPAVLHSGSAMPTFTISPTLTATSLSTPNFEPSGIAVRAVSDTGDGSGIARATSPLYRDWTQQYETKAKTLRRSAVSAHPWTFQDLFEHCRTRFAFLVYAGFGVAEAEVFSFRSEGAMWKPERASPGNDTQFHIPFKAIVEGTYSAYDWG